MQGTFKRSFLHVFMDESEKVVEQCYLHSSHYGSLAQVACVQSLPSQASLKRPCGVKASAQILLLWTCRTQHCLQSSIWIDFGGPFKTCWNAQAGSHHLHSTLCSANFVHLSGSLSANGLRLCKVCCTALECHTSKSTAVPKKSRYHPLLDIYIFLDIRLTSLPHSARRNLRLE